MPDEEKATPDSTKSRKPCPVCAEPVAPAASKCIHCDSYLDWRRHLQISSTALALLIALISVTTTAITVLEKTFRREDSSLSITFQGVVDVRPTLLVANSGQRPGGIGMCSLEISGIWLQQLSLPLEVVGGGGQTFIAAGNSKQIFLSATEQLPKLDDNETKRIKDANCVLVIQATEFSGKMSKFEFKRKCHEFARFIEKNVRLGAGW